MKLLKSIAKAVREGDDAQARELTEQTVTRKIPAKQVLDEGLIAGMNVVGELFKEHEIFLPDVLLAAKAMYAGLDVIKPLLMAEEVPSRGKIVLGTVQGDLHDIGKNLVGIMLKGAGFEIIDLGSSVPPEKFVETAEKEQAAVIGMSTLLTTTMPVMKQVIALVKERGLGDKIKVIVGGAPVTAAYATSIGADAYAYDAGNAVEKVKQLLAGQ
jgi:5-methyltetrahydrofolate--homocysteine methyltransferase